MRLFPIVVASLCCFQLASFAQQPVNRSEVPVNQDQAALTDGNNAFAADLYNKLRSREGNLFFSPESISTALAMTYAGARGETATQMAAALHFTLPIEKLNPAMGGLLESMNAPHTGYQLRVADALWAEKKYRFLDSYTSAMKAHYGAGLHELDFAHEHESARKEINEWVEEKTEKKIRNLLGPGSVTPDTRLVLTNAIYFKGSWQAKFQKDATKEDDFHVSSQRSVKAPLMNLTAKFAYFAEEKFQAVELPYMGDEISMLVLLPNDVDGLAALESSITPDKLRGWLDEPAASQKVILTLPKFTMTDQFELGDTLSQLGMPLAFDRVQADFSGMTGERDLCISNVVHKAFVDVNEEGTEAAAATGTIMIPAAAIMIKQPIVFRADHPFLFVIQDRRSHAILFMGRVVDPTK